MSQINDLQETINLLKIAETKHSSETVCKTEEVLQLKTKMAAISDSLEQSEREKTTLERHVSQLKDDLATMTQDNQVLHGEVSKVREERDVLRRNIDEYSSKVAQFKQQLAIKVLPHSPAPPTLFYSLRNKRKPVFLIPTKH